MKNHKNNVKIASKITKNILIYTYLSHFYMNKYKKHPLNDNN